MLNWYLQNGKDSDVVISSRVRLARNLEEIPFPTKYSKEQAKRVLEKVKEIAPSIGYGIKYMELNDFDDITKVSLVEKHVISPEFAMNKMKTGAILLNDEENICMMINEEDHFRIQSFKSGLDIESAYNNIIQMDKNISEKMILSVLEQKINFIIKSLIKIQKQKNILTDKIKYLGNIYDLKINISSENKLIFNENEFILLKENSKNILFVSEASIVHSGIGDNTFSRQISKYFRLLQSLW